MNERQELEWALTMKLGASWSQTLSRELVDLVIAAGWGPSRDVTGGIAIPFQARQILLTLLEHGSQTYTGLVQKGTGNKGGRAFYEWRPVLEGLLLCGNVAALAREGEPDRFGITVDGEALLGSLD